MNLETSDILIVDDAEANLHLLAEVLKHAGLPHRTAANGTLALQAVSASPPDLILLDVRMPGLSGLEVCRRLKADDRYSDIPIIFISGMDSSDDMIEGFSAGAVDYIAKPFQFDEVLARISTHLSLRTTQKRLQSANEMLQNEIAERKRMEEESRRSQRTLRLLNEITQIAAGALNFADLTQSLADRLGELFSADGCFITMWDPVRKVTTPLAASGPLRDSYARLKPFENELTATESVLKIEHALAIADIHNSPYISPQIASQFSIVSMLALPLIAFGRVDDPTDFSMLGAALVCFDQPHTFSPEEIAIGEQAAGQIGLAISKARLFEETSRRATQFAALYETAQDTAGLVDLPVLLRLLMERARQLLSAKSGTVYLYDEVNQELESVACSDGEIPLGTRLKIGTGMAGQVARERQALIVDDYVSWEGRADIYRDKQFRAVVEAPLLFSGELLGVLALYEVGDSTRKFTKEDAHLLSLFAAHAAAAVHSARLFTEARTHLGQLNRLSTILRAATTTDEMLPRLLEETLAALHASDGGIWIFNHAHTRLEPVVLRGALAEGRAAKIFERGAHRRFLADHQPVTSPEVSDDPNLPEGLRSQFPAQMGGAFVPIRSVEEEIGVLLVAVRNPRAIQPEETRFLSTLAEIAGNAIHRMRLYDLTNRRLHELQALREIDRAISGSQDVKDTLGILLDQTLSRLNIDAASVLLYKPTGKVLEFAAGRGFRTGTLKETRLKLGEGYAGIAAEERRVIHVQDLRGRHTDYLRSPTFLQEDFVTSYAVPLIAKGQLKGVMEVFLRELRGADQEWMEVLEALSTQAAIALDIADLIEGLQHSNLELSRAYETTIEGWAHALDLRERETGQHSQRVASLTERMARALGLDESEIPHIRRGALLHDIGKMGIPDRILLKSSELNDEEWRIMRQHPLFAKEMLSSIEYLQPAVEIPLFHHERWDGKGYPYGLKGEEIPIKARIFSIIDVWDALTSDRPYRPALPEQEVLKYIRLQSGKRFDPSVVKVFFQIIAEPAL